MSLSALKSSAPIRQISLPRLHPAQQAIIDHPARFKVLRCGRRFGKSHVVRDEILMAMLQGETTVYTAPTYGMVKEMWRSLVKLVAFNRIPHYKNETDKFLQFANGGQLSMWSLESPDTIRGGNAHLIVNDECAFVPKLLSIWNEVLSPMLLDFAPHSRAYFPSTPKGRNDFWTLANMGDDPLQPLWKTFHHTTYDNPYIKADEIDALKTTLTQSAYEQEIMAAFMEDAGSVFRNLNAVCVLAARDPYPGRFVFGIDWARDNDFTVISIMDIDTREQVYMERFNRIGWEIQRGRIKALYDAWRPERIIAEENSIGGPNIEALYLEGLPLQPFNTNGQSKGPLINALVLMIERGDIRLLSDTVQTNELEAYAVHRSASGHYKYEAPSGGHDDTVIALALSVKGIGQAVPTNW